MSAAQLPRRLLAPEPGWSIRADLVVIGSGVAGLTVALRAREAGHVLVVTKDVLTAGSTTWAQGGIAAVLGRDDSLDEHVRDTMIAGAGLCDEDAVRTLVREGPDAVLGLAALGTVFDRTDDGSFSLTREGGHRRRRIVHAGGDATGEEVQRSLSDAVRADDHIELIEHAQVLDLLLDDLGQVAGLTFHVLGEGRRDGVGAVLCPTVVLASGGLGQVFDATTNPPVSTGDGVALALRAGAAVRDLEFVQFHPTVLWLGPGRRGQQPLVSEAVRGEGAFLLDGTGHRFMLDEHELAELAPRDVVAKASMRVMRAQDIPHVWLDARHFGPELWSRRFPTILASCREHGIDPLTELIPVAPAAHYASGGVRTDLTGATSVPGLFACGEVACTGVHGANRLASNSLLEGLVFGRRIADHLLARAGRGPEPRPPAPDPRPQGLLDAGIRDELQATMSLGVGVLRSAASLTEAAATLAALAARESTEPQVAAWEATNLLTVASALTAAALAREETRGSHWREDFPERDDERWRGHLDLALCPDTALAATEPGGPVAEITHTFARMDS